MKMESDSTSVSSAPTKILITEHWEAMYRKNIDIKSIRKSQNHKHPNFDHFFDFIPIWLLKFIIKDPPN
jgi:hypothetical protein